MKDITKLSEYLDTFTNKVIENVMKAQKETAQQTWEDVVQKAPFNEGDYVASIKVGETTKKDNIISTEIYTDATVSTLSGKTYNLGMLLETGTNHHAIPNAFGYGYTIGHIGTDGKWHKGTLDPDWHPGTRAQPHFKPALKKNISTYKENIRRAVKEAEK